MTTIRVNYGAMNAGHEGLVATWARIEGHLAELDAVAAATGDMSAGALTAYLGLKAKWTAAATERQEALRALSQSLDRAAQVYREADAAAAAQFLA